MHDERSKLLAALPVLFFGFCPTNDHVVLIRESHIYRLLRLPRMLWSARVERGLTVRV